MDARDSYNRSLIEASPDPLVTIGPDGKITDVNRATELATGYVREELIGAEFADYFTDPARARDGYLEVFRHGVVHNYSLRLRHRDGTSRPVLYNASVYRDEVGRVLGVFAAARDITDRVQAEERERQIEKAESLGRMAGAIAHHYNNLLAIVTGNMELAMEDVPPGSPVAARLADGIKAARRASEVGGLMLTYLGQSTSRHDPLHLTGACREYLAELRSSLPARVALQVAFEEPGPVVLGNPHQLRQVLGNLVSNAVEALQDRDRTIGVAVRTVRADDIPSGVRFPPDWRPKDVPYGCLEVRDEGCGISSQDLARLFDPFFTTKFTGRGLGLPVVIGIVRAHDGVVTVESTVDEGSTFRVYLPVAVLPDRPRVASRSASPMTFSGRVLLVEDDPGVRDVGTAMLQRLGFEVLTAEDGRVALDVFDAHRASIRFVLCDLTMPELDGWETLAALRQRDPHVRVVLASGYDMAHVMAGAPAEEPQAYLSKPFQLAELRDAARRALAHETP